MPVDIPHDDLNAIQLLVANLPRFASIKIQTDADSGFLAVVLAWQFPNRTLMLPASAA
jgi:hypothetical protein